MLGKFIDRGKGSVGSGGRPIGKLTPVSGGKGGGPNGRDTPVGRGSGGRVTPLITGGVGSGGRPNGRDTPIVAATTTG